MKNRNIIFAFVVSFLLTSLSSCSVIGDIFKAGVWVGVIVVVLVVALIIFLISKMRKKD